MKRILLLALMISLCAYLMPQNNTWEVFLQGKAVKSIDVGNSCVWIVTDDYLYKLNKQNKSLTYFAYPEIIRDMKGFVKVDKAGLVWIARSENYGQDADNSIYTFNGNQWQKISFNQTGAFHSLTVDKNNEIWITANASGYRLYRIGQDSYKQFTPDNSGLVYDNATQVSSDKDGNLWVFNFGNLGSLATADIALIRYDCDKWQSYLFGRGIYAFYMRIDSKGNPCFQQFGRVLKLDVASNSFIEEVYFNYGDNYLILNAIEDDDKYWFTSRNNGIAVSCGSEWKYYTTLNSDLPSDTVYQIAIDSNGTKWMATSNGIAAFNEAGLPTSVLSESNMIKDIDLYPNPTQDFINIKLPEELQNSTIDLINIQGEVLKSIYSDNNHKILDVSDLSGGMYLIRIRSNEKTVLKKFIKQ